MKAIVLVDIPEDDALDMLSPFNTKVTLDYGDKVLELSGEVRAIPEKKEPIKDIYWTETEIRKIGEVKGYNECIDEILK